MSQFQLLVESLFILVALCASAIWLRRRGVIRPEEQPVFGRLVTDFALPAIIFVSLSRVPFSTEALMPVLLLLLIGVAIMIPTWLIGRAMGLDRPTIGSLILVAAYGGAATLGLSLIRRVFDDNVTVMRDAVLIGEYGLLLPVFTVGVAVAIHFGQTDDRKVSLWVASRPFFTSPIFIAMILGTAASAIELPQSNRIIEVFEDFLKVAARPLTVLVAFSIGLALKPIAARQLMALVAVTVLLKLVAEPLMAWGLALSFDLPKLERELLVLLAAMPSGAISAVLAARYGCNSAMASAMVVATAVVSLISLPLTLYLGG